MVAEYDRYIIVKRLGGDASDERTYVMSKAHLTPSRSTEAKMSEEMSGENFGIFSGTRRC